MGQPRLQIKRSVVQILMTDFFHIHMYFAIKEAAQFLICNKIGLKSFPVGGNVLGCGMKFVVAYENNIRKKECEKMKKGNAHGI